MVSISVQINHGAARFRVRVQASSIQRAVDLVRGFYSASDVKVVFPIDPEGFFVEDASPKKDYSRGANLRRRSWWREKRAAGTQGRPRKLSLCECGGRQKGGERHM